MSYANSYTPSRDCFPLKTPSYLAIAMNILSILGDGHAILEHQAYNKYSRRVL